jgi:uncharacterized protein
VREFRGGRQVVFEGSYGVTHDMVTHGMQKASLRRLDTARSEPWRPVHPFTDPEPLRNGDVVPVEIELLPSATLFRRGDVLRLDVQGRWFFRKNPLRGQFPAAYETSVPATACLHIGGGYDARLLIPMVV